MVNVRKNQGRKRKIEKAAPENCRFNELLKQSGKTQVEIAKALNVTKQCIND